MAETECAGHALHVLCSRGDGVGEGEVLGASLLSARPPPPFSPRLPISTSLLASLPHSLSCALSLLLFPDFIVYSPSPSLPPWGWVSPIPSAPTVAEPRRWGLCSGGLRASGHRKPFSWSSW